MKTKMTRITSLFLAAALLLLTFAGCGKGAKKADTVVPSDGPGLADLVETDKLVIYTSDMYESLDRRRIDLFTVLYDIDVEIVVTKYEEYSERVMNDLAGGSGPDVLFLYQMDEDGAVIDIPKAAINNNFLDLTNILAEDPDFTKDNYIDGVLESGQFGGRQYLIPTSCDIPLIVSSAEKLKELVFDWNDVETMSDYLNALAELTPKAKENPSFSHMLSSKNYFIPFLMLSGIQLIDYENGVVLPEEKDLREFLKAYKSFFPYDYEENGVPWFYNLGDDRLISGRNVFWFPLDLPGFASSVSVMKNKSCDFEIHTILGQQSENTTTLSGTLAINANAENSLNAYRFIKFMLSEETQKDPQTLPGYLPIHKECIRKIVSTAPAINANDNMTYDYDHTALTTEEAEMVCEMLMDIDRFVHPSPILNNMVFDSMLPYFRDEDSYKNCLDELRSKLKFYLSE